MKRRRGFTLVELVIVIVIIIVLAIGLAVILGSFTDEAKDTTDTAQLVTTAKEAEIHLKAEAVLPNNVDINKISQPNGYQYEPTHANVIIVGGKPIIVLRCEDASRVSAYGRPYGVNYIMDWDVTLMGTAPAADASVDSTKYPILENYTRDKIQLLIFDATDSGAEEIVLSKSHFIVPAEI